MDKGSTVILTVSSGPATGEFPDVVDTEVGEAERRIRAQKFTAEIAIETQVSDAVAPGTVVRQSPAPGPQPLGVPIVLTVAIPETTTTTEAPSPPRSAHHHAAAGHHHDAAAVTTTTRRSPPPRCR